MRASALLYRCTQEYHSPPSEYKGYLKSALRAQAFVQRNDWTRLEREWRRNGNWERFSDFRPLIRRLQSEAISMRVVNPRFVPSWMERVEPVSLPEAAALRDNGEVMRLIALGSDPNQPGAVRKDLAHNEEFVLTPLEAAVSIERVDMVELLLENGARMDAATWTRLLCFADLLDAGEVRVFLEQRRPQDASVSCEGVSTPW